MKTEETITNFNETILPEENVNNVEIEEAAAAKPASKWKHVAIGGVAGIAMGVAGTLVGTETVSAAEASEQPEAAPETPAVPVATSVNDDMSFGEAFAAARAEVGAGGVFEWHGKIYNTYYAEEWEALSPAEREEFYESVVQQADVAETDATGAEPGVADDTSISEIPVATSVNDDMSFNEAFAAARAEVGAGGVFEWHGRTYNTYYAEEWNDMSPAERNDFYAAVAGNATQTPPAVEATDIEIVENEAENEARVIGVFEENIEGQDVYVGAMEIDGESVMLIDIDQDGVFDVAVADVNGDGVLDENEVADVSCAGIEVEDLVARAAMDSANDVLAANDLPDYVNDADVSMC